MVGTRLRRHQGGLNLLGRRLRRQWLAVLANLVRQRPKMDDIERQPADPFGRKQHSRARFGGVPNTEFVEDVGIGRRQVGDGIFAEDEPLEHWRVDDSAGFFLIGAKRLEAGFCNRRGNERVVDRIEIDSLAAVDGFLPNGISTKQSGLLTPCSSEGTFAFVATSLRSRDIGRCLDCRAADRGRRRVNSKGLPITSP